jgi:hypothetical protein
MASNEIGEKSNRMQILEMIEQGRITAEEGLHLLQALNDLGNLPDEAAEQDNSKLTGETPMESVETAPSRSSDVAQGIPLPGPTFTTPSQPDGSEPVTGKGGAETASSFASNPEVMPDQLRWKRWWMIPLWIGVTVAVFGGVFMFLAQRSSGIGLWFVCAAVPFTLGLILIILAWQSRRSPWLHLRVQQPPGEWPEKIAFSFPLPVQPTSWFFRTFGRYIHGLEGQNLEQIIKAVGEKTTPENPISIHVDDPDGGERVDIYIG